MRSFDTQYAELIRRIVTQGDVVKDRTGVGTKRILGATLDMDLRRGFPLLGLRNLRFDRIVGEVLWFLSGEDTDRVLKEHGIFHWDAWRKGTAPHYDTLPDGRSVPVPGRYGHGLIGRVYGVQWRGWRATRSGETFAIDQLTQALNILREDPHSRRNVVMTWNPAELEQMALPPCPFCFQLIREGSEVHMWVTLRSSDVALGLPRDVAHHALILEMYAAMAGLVAGRLVFQLSDTHIYLNHLEQMRELMDRPIVDAPVLGILDVPETFDGWGQRNFQLYDYTPCQTPLAAGPMVPAV